jgi:hypothetical protein
MKTKKCGGSAGNNAAVATEGGDVKVGRGAGRTLRRKPLAEKT